MKSPIKFFLISLFTILSFTFFSFVFFENFNLIDFFSKNDGTQKLEDKKYFSNSGEIRFEITPIGILSIGNSFRVHPSNNNQKETPIVSSFLHRDILFGAANILVNYTSPSYSIGGYISTNGGTNWYGTDTIYTNSGLSIIDPVPLITNSGKLLISFIDSSYYLKVVNSTNNGLTWSSPVTINTVGVDKCWMEIDDDSNSPNYGNTYCTYNKGASFQIFFAASTNEGINWIHNFAISPPPPSYWDTTINRFVISSHLGSETKTSSNGTIFVAWTNRYQIGTSFIIEDSLGFAKSTNGGSNWIVSTNHADDINGIRGNGFPYSMPRLEIDKSNSHLYVILAEKKYNNDTNYAAKDSADIILHKSTNSGSSWQRMRVNQDPAGNNKKQFLPAVKVDKFGGVNVIYYDTRNTPTNDSCEIYLSRSIDGGEHWTDTKVSNKFGFPNLKHGDYIGLTTSNNKLWPLWFQIETSSGKHQAYTAEIDILPTPLEVSVTTEGLAKINIPGVAIPDTFKIYLRNNTSPYQIIDSSRMYNSSSGYTGNVLFSNLESNEYYLIINHRNGIEIWSQEAISLIKGDLENRYSFSSARSQAYGNNLTMTFNNTWGMYSGDVNQDGTIDLTDVGLIDNDALNFLSGYVSTDLNGDLTVDLSDGGIADNNASNFITLLTP